MREADVECYLCKRVRELGGQVRKVKWLGRNSAPDRRVMLPGNAFWAEIKAPGKVPTKPQLREHARLRAVGERIEVIDSFYRVDEVLA